MSGSLNQLLMPAAASGGASSPGTYTGVLPNVMPHGTYTGAIPTPPSDYAAKIGELPPEYYHMQQFMNQFGPDDPRLNQLLQLLYFHRQGRI